MIRGSGSRFLRPPCGVRLDRFLAEPLGSRAKAATLIDSQRVRVDGRIRPKRHLVSAGELIDVDPGESEPVAIEGAVAAFEVAYEDEHLLVVDKPAGVVVHPARGHWQRHARTGAGGAWRRRRRAVASGNRAPARPGDLGLAGRRQERRGPPSAQAGAKAARAPPRVPGARRGQAAGADRNRRGADRPAPPRPHADVDRHAPSRARRARTSRSSGRSRTRRCCGSCWTPGVRTRFGSTWPRSATRSPAIPSTGSGACTGSSASSCTPRGSRSRIR